MLRRYVHIQFELAEVGLVMRLSQQQTGWANDVHKLFLHNLRYVIGQALYAILGPTYPASNVVTTKKF